jgi:hypothetical protein
MKGKVKIAIDSHGGTIEVDGEIFGIVAVTPCRSSDGRALVVTHIKTGWALSPPLCNKRKAAKLARLVNDHAKVFTGLSTKRKTKRNREAADLFHALWIRSGLKPYWIDAATQPVV